MTPLLIFMGIPPATAVGTESVQILGSSVSGAMAHGLKKNIDYEIGIFLLIGGIFGSTIGVILFNFLKESGNIDLIINILYVIFLSVIALVNPSLIIRFLFWLKIHKFEILMSFVKRFIFEFTILFWDKILLISLNSVLKSELPFKKK